jgi:hypothetical protein
MTQPMLEISKAVPAVDQRFNYYEATVTDGIDSSMAREKSWDEFVSEFMEFRVGEKKAGVSLLLYVADLGPAGRCPRTEKNVLWGPPVAAIDADGLVLEENVKVRKWLNSHKIDYVMHTTHSYGSEKKVGKFCCRFMIRLDRPQATRDEIKAVRWGFGLLVQEQLGIDAKAVSDPAVARAPYLPIFLPAEAPERAGTGVIAEGFGGRALSVDLLVEYGARVVAEQARLKAEKEAKELVESALPNEVKNDPAQIEAALREVYRGCRQIENRETDLRQLTELRTYTFGRYIKAGLLDFQSTYDDLCEAIATRSKKYPDRSNTLKERFAQVRKGLKDGMRASPKYPLSGFVHNGRTYVQTFAQAELEKKLQALVPSETVAVDRAVARLVKLFQTRPSKPTVVEISFGAGKTRAMVAAAMDWAMGGKPVLICQPDHGLMAQTYRDFGDFPVSYLKSPKQPTSKTGQPQCLRRHEKAVLAVIQNHGNLTASVCRTCALKPDCEAFKNNSKERQLVTVAPGIMSPSLTESILDDGFMAPDLLTFFDEEPAGPKEVFFTKDDLMDLASDVRWVSLLEGGMGSKLLDLVNALWSGKQAPDSDFRLSEMMFKGASETINQHKEKWRTLTDLISVLPFWHTKRVLDNGQLFVFTVTSPEWAVVEQNNAFVLTATPNEKLYEGKNYERVRLDCADSHTTLRAMIYTRDVSRAVLCPNGAIQLEQLQARLDDVFDLVGDQPTLLVTYMCISDALNGHLKHLLQGRDISVSYFEVMLGVNEHRSKRKLVTLGDPRTPPPIGTKDFSQSEEIASNRIGQAHGRTRDCRRTDEEGAADHFHFGTVFPKGWHHMNCFVYHAESFGDKTDRLTPQVVAALRLMSEEIGKAATAKRVGVGASTLREWLSHRANVGSKHLDDVCAVLGIDTRLPGQALSDLKTKLQTERAN